MRCFYDLIMTTLTFTEQTPRDLTICADSNYDANWYYTVKTIPGTYVARCTTLQGVPCDLEDAYWVHVSIDATCTGGYIPAHKGNGADKSLHKPMPFSFTTYGYEVMASLKKADTPYAIQATVSA